MSQEHFIKNIEIKNFKLFKDFKAEGFGRVNLIGGKNNVGKTAFMEACYLSQSDSVEELFSRLLEIKTHRDVVNNLLSKNSREEDIRDLIKNNIGINILVGEICEIEENISFEELFEGEENCQNKYIKISLDKDKGLYNIFLDKRVYKNNPIKSNNYTLTEIINILNTFLQDTKCHYSLNFISPYSNSNKELENIIGDLKLKKRYTLLNSYLKEVFNIDLIDIIKDKPMLEINGNYLELSEYGQGVKSFINIIASLLLLEENNIFIDEIESGIHYSNYDKLWEIILKISKEQNVQVFATTHSKECIESFNKIQKKLQNNESYYFEMYRNAKKDKIEMRRLDNEQLEYELTHKGRFRGE